MGYGGFRKVPRKISYRVRVLMSLKMNVILILKKSSVKNVVFLTFISLDDTLMKNTLMKNT